MLGYTPPYQFKIIKYSNRIALRPKSGWIIVGVAGFGVAALRARPMNISPFVVDLSQFIHASHMDAIRHSFGSPSHPAVNKFRLFTVLTISSASLLSSIAAEAKEWASSTFCRVIAPVSSAALLIRSICRL